MHVLENEKVVSFDVEIEALCLTSVLCRDVRATAAFLVHEARHLELNALLLLTPLVEKRDAHGRDDSTVHYASWRSDPRPALGLFHGVFALTGVAAVSRLSAAEVDHLAGDLGTGDCEVDEEWITSLLHDLLESAETTLVLGEGKTRRPRCAWPTSWSFSSSSRAHYTVEMLTLDSCLPPSTSPSSRARRLVWARVSVSA
ncbi:aKG-HExxH-type peptide beta-hydroxylase [Streptomyces sp. NBC_00989]|uniref:aKG-HExxH-type peptide beta-hydroxylase n=1 Tax=Streptomyces sp. NBC_00989 TaxID=2903705 RepID=UPI002F9158E1|nr:HEXXH motif-containing putative peptide modification protein [Streptomyces sp. NBC_00989]